LEIGINPSLLVTLHLCSLTGPNMALFLVAYCRCQARWDRILHSTRMLPVTRSRVLLVELLWVRSVQQIVRWRSAFFVICWCITSLL